MKTLFVRTTQQSYKKKLYFFHHAGGSSAQYTILFRQLNLPIEIHLLNLPGRLFHQGAEPYTDFESVANELLLYFKKLENSEIYLLGHSMGALFVYWLVLHQEQLNLAIKSFGISSLSAPTLRSRKKKRAHLDNKNLLVEVEKYHILPEFIKRDPAILQLTLETLRNDFKVIESFVPLPIHFDNLSSGYLFGGTDDPLVTEHDLSEWELFLNFKSPPILYPGGHFYIFNELSSIIQTLLEGKDRSTESK